MDELTVKQALKAYELSVVPRRSNVDIDKRFSHDRKTKLYKKYKENKISKLLALVGNESRFQHLFMICIFAVNVYFGFLNNSLPFLFYRPSYLCYDKRGLATECNANRACN